LTSRDLIFAVQDYLSNTLRYQAALIATDQEMHVHAAIPEDVRRQAGKLIASREPAVSTLIDPRSGRAWLVRIINPEILGYGAIAIDLGDSRAEYTDATARRVETLLEEATLTLKHLKAKEAIEQATLNYQTEVLRDALVGGVSHELRTPLATILGTCSVLNRIPAIQGDRQSRELVRRASGSARQRNPQFARCRADQRQRRSSAADVERPDGHRQRRVEAEGTQARDAPGRPGCRSRRSAGSRRHGFDRAGARTASGKCREILPARE